MIILSQEKEVIINFNNIEMIGINPDCKNEIFCTFNDGAEEMGTYKTEERAKEVLQEIVNKYKQWNKDANNAVTIMPKVYEMPKE